uniref:F-box domain-containing protein n=1 Tax=Rhabditophanes sp. KR3021 TaxID=114890 RepID=A0AC35THY6_9BILA
MIAHILGRRGRKIFFEPSIILAKKKSYKEHKNPHSPVCTDLQLPDAIWGKVFDELEPFDLIRMRKVSKQFERIVETKLSNTLYLDVMKCDLNDVIIEDTDNDGEFYKHKKCQLLIAITQRSVCLIVDERWTNKDVQCLWGCLQFFAKYAHTVCLDVQIFELISVGLSSLKLSRWYTFESYVGSIGLPESDNCHLKITSANCGRTFSSCAMISGNSNGCHDFHRMNPDGVEVPLFPKIKELTIKSSPYDMAHLSRIVDYHIHPCNFFNLEKIELIRITVGQCKSKLPTKAKKVHQHLRVFRGWLDSLSLAEKYVEQRHE